MKSKRKSGAQTKPTKKAEREYQESATQIAVAENEIEKARIERRSAKVRRKSAQRSGNTIRINDAKRELHAALLMHRAAQVRFAALKAKRRHLRDQVRVADEARRIEEAKLELAKAKLAHENDIQPYGFRIETFEGQVKAREQRTQQAKTQIQG